jgi:hypothetical protein
MDKLAKVAEAQDAAAAKRMGAIPPALKALQARRAAGEVRVDPAIIRAPQDAEVKKVQRAVAEMPDASKKAAAVGPKAIRHL